MAKNQGFYSLTAMDFFTATREHSAVPAPVAAAAAARVRPLFELFPLGLMTILPEEFEPFAGMFFGTCGLVFFDLCEWSFRVARRP